MSCGDDAWSSLNLKKVTQTNSETTEVDIDGAASIKKIESAEAEGSESTNNEVFVKVEQSTKTSECKQDCNLKIGRSANTPIIMATRRYYEPPTFVSETINYTTYRDDLERWSRITSTPKTQQADEVVYGLPMDIKEKVAVNIGDKIKDSEQGMQMNSLMEFTNKMKWLRPGLSIRTFKKLCEKVT